MNRCVEEQIKPRLIVLITADQTGNTHLANKIHWIADRESREVLYLIIINEDEDTLSVDRTVTTMKAITATNRLAVESVLVGADAWLDQLEKMLHPGDIVVCQEEQTVLDGAFKQVPVGKYLSTEIEAPVQVVSGVYRVVSSPAGKRFQELGFFAGFLVIAGLFCWLQIRIESAFPDAQSLLLIFITFLVELGAILAWHHTTYR